MSHVSRLIVYHLLLHWPLPQNHPLSFVKAQWQKQFPLCLYHAHGAAPPPPTRLFLPKTFSLFDPVKRIFVLYRLIEIFYVKPALHKVTTICCCKAITLRYKCPFQFSWIKFVFSILSFKKSLIIYWKPKILARRKLLYVTPANHNILYFYTFENDVNPMTFVEIHDFR